MNFNRVRKLIDDFSKICKAAFRYVLGLTNILAEILLIVVVAICVLPHTIICIPFEKIIIPHIAKLGELVSLGRTFMYSPLFMLGCITLIFLLSCYMYRRFTYCNQMKATYHLTDTICLLSCIYLFNGFVSTAYDWQIESILWPFPIFCCYLIIVLCFNKHQCLRLSNTIVLCVAYQSIYAIIYYFLGINQFKTPHFGSRTSGTFGNPGVLSPLCLIALFLSMALCEIQVSAWWRWTFRVSSVVIITALLLTFMRSGWLAFSFTILLTIKSYRYLWQSKARRVLAITMTFALILGTIFLRTSGSTIGNSQDRSTWGRIAIWMVAGQVVRQHFWFGAGLGTYEVQQRKSMTLSLEGFNPTNQEAKSLYLNTTAELGAVGLIILSSVAFCYFQFRREALSHLKNTSGNEVAAVLNGVYSGVISIAIVGLADTPILEGDHTASTLIIFMLLGVSCVVVEQHRTMSTSGTSN